MNGIIIIDKPQNYTSFDVIAILRKKLNQKKIGHMGTLDPMATGVLPVVVGDSAKFQIYANNHDKEYIAKIQLGISTDTLDSTGHIICEKKCNVNKNQFLEVLKKFKGEIQQLPPMFSAIKINGKKLYELARKGIEVNRKKRNVNIYNLELLNFDEKNQIAEIKVFCSQGTYIRTLCNDIGTELNCPSVMSYLRRTLSGGFKIESSITPEKIKDLSLKEIQEKYLLPTDMLLQEYEKIQITKAQSDRFKNGGALALSRLHFEKEFQNEAVYRLYCNGNFVGIGRANILKEELKVLKCVHYENE